MAQNNKSLSYIICASKIIYRENSWKNLTNVEEIYHVILIEKRVSKITKYIMGLVLHMFVLQNESTMYEITLLLINIVTRPETV